MSFDKDQENNDQFIQELKELNYILSNNEFANKEENDN